jgi:16S rRNA (guanine527-N7)-methyltransferase
VARDFRTRLQKRASRIGLNLENGLVTSLAAFYELLARWNEKINLTALSNTDEAIDRLLLEPVVAARMLGFRAGPIDMMDVGTGGGSPAIPAALALGPETLLTMVEVKARKSAFLREAVRQLRLDGAVVENARYEELLARPSLLDRFELVTIRAVRVEPKALMTLQAFLKPGGTMALFRGPSGPPVPATIVHPLEWVATAPLLEALQSRLTILRKRST